MPQPNTCPLCIAGNGFVAVLKRDEHGKEYRAMARCHHDQPRPEPKPVDEVTTLLRDWKTAATGEKDAEE
jgi:hypothetical protein